MAIKELITLEGVDQVKAALDQINVAGEQSLKAFRDLGSAGGGSSFDSLVEGAKKAGVELGSTSESTIKLSTALKALKPALAEAGLGLGNLGALARLANQNLAAFGVATAAAAAVGLGKLEENAARVRGELQDVFRGTGAGNAAFDALSRSAAQFGTTVGALAPGLEAFQKALANISTRGFVALKAEDLPFGNVRNVDAVAEAYNNFIKLLRAGRLSQNEAEKSATSFFNALVEGGQLTKAALQALPVGTIDLLKQALGAAGLSTKQFFDAVDAGRVPVDRLQQALAAFGPQAEKAFDARAIKTMGDEIGRILADLNAGFTGLTGKPFSDFVIGELERIRKGIRDTRDEFSDFIEFIRRVEQQTEIPDIGPLVTKLRGGAAVPLPQPRPPGADQVEVIKSSTASTVASTAATDENTAAKNKNAAAIKAQFEAEREAIAVRSESIQQSIDEGRIDVEEGVRQLNAAHDALIDARRKQDEALKDAAGGEETKAAAKKAGEETAVAFGSGFIQNPFFQEELPQAIADALKSGIAPTTDQAELVAQFKETGVQIGQALQQGAQQTPVDFSTWIEAVQAFATQAENLAQQAYEAIKSTFSQPIQIQGQFTGFGGQAEGAPFARGGRVFGAGTATSDSIFALLSRGEFVVNARATELFLPLLHAINAGRLPPDFIGRFSMGGLVRALSGNGNKFAAGGQVQTASGAPVTINIDRETFTMHGDEKTVQRMRRYSVKAQLSSAGRKPSWVR